MVTNEEGLIRPIGFFSSRVPKAELEVLKDEAKEPNKYLECISTLWITFLEEESNGCSFTLDRLNTGIKAARRLYPKDRQKLSEYDLI